MGRMMLITPRAARTYIHKIILDKWPMLARHLPDGPKKKFKKMIFIVAFFGQLGHAFVHAGRFLR
tara:strand:- start:2720 stop:2914 length:195 start_codon:yes stop_codon:yes gene_type:complete